jgi:riboflavin synthase
MFTGIVEAVGTIVELVQGNQARRLAVATDLPVERLPLGASIAVDGVCLTVVERGPGGFAADLGPETLARTTLGRKAVGDRVHLERPLAVGDALGGHLVAGHVDGVGTVVVARAVGAAHEMQIAAPAEVGRYLVPKGSVAVDGVSLTVNEVVGDAAGAGGGGARFGVTLIPHTLAATALGARPVGAEVNLEADLVAKHIAAHVERLVELYAGARGAGP